MIVSFSLPREIATLADSLVIALKVSDVATHVATSAEDPWLAGCVLT